MVEQKETSVTIRDKEESFLVKICECYFIESKKIVIENVNKKENDVDEYETKKENDDEENQNETENFIENETIDDDENNSLINETGSLKDETQGNCQWTESLIDKEESIYNMTLPKSFYELDSDTESPYIKKTNFGNIFTRKHKRNLSLHDFSSILDKKEVANLKVDAWLNDNKKKSEFKSSGEKKKDADIEILFNKHTEEDTKVGNYQRKIHPKYANNIDYGSDALDNNFVLSGSSGVKRKRIATAVGEADESFPKKFKNSKKGWISSLSGWVADLFN